MNIVDEPTSEIALRKGLTSIAGSSGTEMGFWAARYACRILDDRSMLIMRPPVADLHASMIYGSYILR